ncbi:hypothetical protein A1D29_03500 [Pasteurellaceae bacterium Orientalotternb1]|nr:hypothetical protein A1D29_03500 [Pasteurellaceae bacterium Orientalotternb1]
MIYKIITKNFMKEYAIPIILAVFALLITLPFSVPRLLGYNKIEYKDFYNFQVDVKENKLVGMLNKYRSIRSINDKCYFSYCGFPKEGRYEVSTLRLVYINNTPYIFYSCINSGECFYNINDSFIESKKNEGYESAKVLLFGMLLAIIGMIIEVLIKSFIKKK